MAEIAHQARVLAEINAHWPTASHIGDADTLDAYRKAIRDFLSL